MCHVYILYSQIIDEFYVWHCCENLEERLRKHLSNHKGFMAKAKDWRYFHVAPFDSKSKAYRRALEIKRKNRERISKIWAIARNFNTSSNQYSCRILETIFKCPKSSNNTLR